MRYLVLHICAALAFPLGAAAGCLKSEPIAAAVFNDDAPAVRCESVQPHLNLSSLGLYTVGDGRSQTSVFGVAIDYETGSKRIPRFDAGVAVFRGDYPFADDHGAVPFSGVRVKGLKIQGRIWF